MTSATLTGSTPATGDLKRSERYHHGDLRAALLRAAEAELEQKGIEGFTLRGCAKRAGVSHAAPAHHFRDANALLTALAASAFERFVETQREAMTAASADPRSQIAAAGIGNIRFAMAHPALFRLIFSSDRPDYDDPLLCKPANEAFALLVDGVAAVTGRNAWQKPEAFVDVYAAWATVHGLADLLMSGRMKHLAAMTQPEREAILEEIIRRALP